ncbi:MAG: hypothetical protein ACREVL_14580 [Solimonas sp.]
MSMFPLVRFDPLVQGTANVALQRWGHKMGPCLRPVEYGWQEHGLYFAEDLMAVTIAAPLVRQNVGGGLQHLNRGNCIELVRLCAARPGLCRVALRLWREFVFPGLGVPVAVSYQDTNLHTGDTYRFDGWERIGFCRSGGSDPRTGRAGRDRAVWAWPRGASTTLKEIS